MTRKEILRVATGAILPITLLIVVFTYTGRTRSIVHGAEPLPVSKVGEVPCMSDKGVYRTYRISEITKVVDGDTLDCWFTVWDKVRVHERIRFYGVNTPERGKPNYVEATDFVKALVNAEGATVYLKTDMSRGSFGRTLGYILVYKDGKYTNLSELLLEKGLAVPYVK